MNRKLNENLKLQEGAYIVHARKRKVIVTDLQNKLLENFLEPSTGLID